MGSQPPPMDPRMLRNFIKVGEYDLYAIAVQESGFTTSQSHFLDYFKGIMGSEYITLASVTLWQIQLVVMCRKRHFMKVTNVQGESQATGLLNVCGNKGGVGIGLRINETGILFISCHLAANKGKMAREDSMMDATHLRNQNAAEILGGLKIGNKELDVESQYQHVFFMGDLNYRVEKMDYQRAVQISESKNYKLLLQADQLIDQIKKGHVLSGYQEAEITFAPTFKYVEQSEKFDLKKKRNPSYTDRILYKSYPGHPISCLQYDSNPDIRLSDHRPLFGVYKINTVRPFASIFAKSDGDCNIVFDEISVSGRGNQDLIKNAVLTFYSHWVDVYPQTGSKLFKPIANPKWTRKQIPVIIPSTPHMDYMRIQCLIISLRDGKPKGDTSNLIGTCVLPLRSAVNNANNITKFDDISLNKGGVSVAKMSGKLTIVYK
ncbi:hypothetical protein AKO1_014382 [Acrasis kona]|uniref:Inositol polyphosphate-related phosphatase domain-containing protein n=1 Tax=Acrasis kona TaxID=1008807 RepID=A0AAW2YZR2_9EUKA